jgi:hypothetical protein
MRKAIKACRRNGQRRDDTTPGSVRWNVLGRRQIETSYGEAGSAERSRCLVQQSSYEYVSKLIGCPAVQDFFRISCLDLLAVATVVYFKKRVVAFVGRAANGRRGARLRDTQRRRRPEP